MIKNMESPIIEFKEAAENIQTRPRMYAIRSLVYIKQDCQTFG